MERVGGGRRAGIVLAMLMVGSSQAAAAQTNVEVTFQGGLAVFLGRDPVGFLFAVADAGGGGSGSGENRVEPGWTVGGAARVRFGRRWAFGPSAQFSFTEVTPPQVSDGVDLKIRTVTGDAVHYVPLGTSRADAFVTVGGGVRAYPALGETVTYPTWNVGGGVELPLGAAGLRLELRNQMAITDMTDFQPTAMPPFPSDRRFQSDLLFLVGLSFYGEPRPTS